MSESCEANPTSCGQKRTTVQSSPNGIDGDLENSRWMADEKIYLMCFYVFHVLYNSITPL